MTALILTCQERGNHFSTRGQGQKYIHVTFYVNFHKRHMQFLTSALNFRGQVAPWSCLLVSL